MTEEILARARDALARMTPQHAVVALTPATMQEATHLARRLPLLHEHHTREAAVARIAATLGMRAFALTLRPDGTVGPDPMHHRHRPGRGRKFPGDGCTVTYTPLYLRDTDHFYFVGHGDPPRPHPLGQGGYWSHFAHPDAVAAMGGPEAYAAALQVGGWEGAYELTDAFEGRRPATGGRAAKQAAGVPPEPPEPTPVVHAAAIIGKSVQGRLF